MRFSTQVGFIAALAIAVSSGPFDVTTARGEDALAAGVTLGKNNWKLAEGLLPPEILAHYRDGAYANPIVEWPVDFYNWPTDFKAATEANVGKYEIGPEGQVIEKATGEQPAYIIGFPFPEIDENDPRAASKILWNFNYRTWYFGNSKNESQVNWVSNRKLERRMDVEASFKYYDGVPANERPKENPQNLSVQFLTVVQAPTDVNGTAALSWRYLDPRKRDSSWSFVPALRRVRAVSPANRSDGFLGSDMSQDDGPFFDGKPEDFSWKLKGTTDQLRLIDPLSLEQAKSKQSGENVWLDDGGWRANWPDLEFIGYMDESWDGIPWAPRTGALALRPHWVLEGVPKDRYYLYGKIELYIDKVTYQGSWNRKFSWKDEVLNTYQVMAFIPIPVTRPDGGIDFVQGSNMAFQCAENIKRNQATVAGIKQNPKSGFDSHVSFDESFFDMNTLTRYGK
jgi:hypothetical protein